MPVPAMKTRDWLAACAPPRRTVDLAATKPATPAARALSEPFLERADEHHPRALRHLHALPLPQLLRGALDYVLQRAPAEVDVPRAPCDARRRIRAGGELVASVHAVVAHAACAATDALPVIAPRRGALAAGWALYVYDDALALVVAPPEEFGADDVREFVKMRQYRYSSWGADSVAKRPFTPAELLWATLYDCAAKDSRSPKFFVVSTYNEWIFGCFSEHLTTAWISHPLNYTAHTPSVPEVLCYWLASARGAHGAHKVPAVAERAPRLLGMQLHDGALRAPRPRSPAAALRLIEARSAFNAQLVNPVPEPEPDSDSDDLDVQGGMLARLGMPKLAPFPAARNSLFPEAGGRSLFAELERAVVGVTSLMEEFAMSCEPFRLDDDEEEEEEGDDEDGFTLRIASPHGY